MAAPLYMTFKATHFDKNTTAAPALAGRHTTPASSSCSSSAGACSRFRFQACGYSCKRSGKRQTTKMVLLLLASQPPRGRSQGYRDRFYSPLCAGMRYVWVYAIDTTKQGASKPEIKPFDQPALGLTSAPIRGTSSACLRPLHVPLGSR